MVAISLEAKRTINMQSIWLSPIAAAAFGILVFLVVMGATLVVRDASQEARYREETAETRITATQVAKRLETWVDAHVDILEVAGRAIARIDDPEGELEPIATDITRTYINFQAVNWIDSEGTIVTVAPREENLPALGRNVSKHDNPGVRDAFLRAVAAKRITRSPATITLYQGGVGFTTYLPVYDENGELQGLLNGVLKIDALVDACLDEPDLRERFAFSILEEDGVLVYTSEGDVPIDSPATIGVTIPVRLVDTPASLHFAIRDEVLMSSEQTLGLGLTLGGLASAILLGSLTTAGIRRHARVVTSEQRYHDLFQGAPVPYFNVDTKGKISRANRAASDLTGYSQGALYELDIRTLFAASPNGLAKAERIISEVASGQSVVGEELELYTKSGDVVDVLLAADPVCDERGIVVAARASLTDITARKNAQQYAERSELHLRTILENTLEGIITLDATGAITNINRQAVELFKTSYESTVWERVDKLIQPGDRWIEGARVEWPPSSLGGRAYTDWVGRASDGKCFPIRVGFGEFTIGGEVGYVCSLFDVSRELELEAQLIQSQKMEAVGTLSGGIAHDFNNLLQAMLGALELARTSTDAASLEESYGQLERSIDRARDLISHLLLFSRGSGLEKDANDLRELISESLDMMRGMIPSSVEIEYCAPDTPHFANVSRSVLEQALLNLGINSYHATQGAGGKILVRLMTNTHEDGQLQHVIEFEDNGCGMPPEIMERVFEPYFTTKDTGKGNGLGLAMVHGAVKSHGGTISIQSTEGVGTVVSICLPAVAGTALAAAKSHVDTDRNTHPLQIVLVDDEDAVCRSLATLLTRMGYRVNAFTDAREALDFATKAVEPIDVVVTDLSMPYMTGDQLIAELRTTIPELPAVICTGFDADLPAPTNGSAGPQTVVHKPISARALADAIELVYTA